MLNLCQFLPNVVVFGSRLGTIWEKIKVIGHNGINLFPDLSRWIYWCIEIIILRVRSNPNITCWMHFIRCIRFHSDLSNWGSTKSICYSSEHWARQTKWDLKKKSNKQIIFSLDLFSHVYITRTIRSNWKDHRFY